MSNNTICSCPSAKNGFYQSRYLVAILNKNNENKSKYKQIIYPLYINMSIPNVINSFYQYTY